MKTIVINPAPKKYFTRKGRMKKETKKQHEKELRFLESIERAMTKPKAVIELDIRDDAMIKRLIRICKGE